MEDVGGSSGNRGSGPDPARRWRIECFGGLRAVRGGTAVERFRTRRGAVLLAYLACHPGRTFGRDALAEMLWPGAEPGVGRTRLKNELSSLRRQLADEAGGGDEASVAAYGTLQTEGRDGVALGPGATSDVAEFEAALREAARPAAPAERRVGPLARAADIAAGGDLLPGFDEDWVLSERERLRERRLALLCRLSADLLAVGRPDEARRRAEEAAAAFPEREEAATAALQAASAIGDVAAARRAFDRHAARLKGAGEYPSPALVRLLAQVTQGAGAKGLGGPDAVQQAPVADPDAPAPDGAVRVILPSPATRFFGRAYEVARVLGWVMAGAEGADGDGGRLFTVTGLGGVGKTRLVLEAARLAAELPPEAPAAPDLVCLVPLASASAGGDLIGAVLDALGAAPGPDPRAAVRGALSGFSRPLLVLDNFEQLAEEGAALLAVLLAEAPGLRCLVTSRRLLDIAGERELPLGPLPVPTEGAGPELLASSEAVRLFVDRARLARADFALTPRTAPAVADICRLLEGVPLALELAAARALVLSPAQMLAGLSDRFSFLVSRRRDLPERHRSLRAALDWSVGALTPALRRAFARLSVFRGGWTLAAAQAVCPGKPPILDVLERLRADSLLSVTDAPEPRFGMLDTLRLYADELLTPDERADARRLHAAYFQARMEGAPAAAGWGASAELLTLFDAEEENLRAAFDWSLRDRPAREPAALLRMVCLLEPCWFARGRFTEGEAACRSALESTAWAGDLPERAAALVCASTFVRSRGDHAGADALLTDAERIYAATGDAGGAAAALRERGYVALRVRDFATARSLLARAARLFEHLDDAEGRAATGNLLGLVAVGEGRAGEGEPLLQESLAAFEALGDEPAVAYARLDLGAAMARGAVPDDGGAEDLLRRALDHFTGSGERQGVAFCLEAFAQAAARRGAWGRAVMLAAAGAALREGLEMPLPPYDAAYQTQMLDAARVALGPSPFDAAWEAGAALSPDDAIAVVRKAAR